MSRLSFIDILYLSFAYLADASCCLLIEITLQQKIKKEKSRLGFYVRSIFMKTLSSDALAFLGSTKPFTVLKQWLDEALQIPNLKQPWAMCLSTVTAKNQSRSRIVLLKKLEKNHLLFFTNYNSPKGQDLKHNSSASVVLFWPQLEKQIRISGRVTKIPKKESIKYWNKRGRDSQLSQWISQQSEKIKDRKTLENLKRNAEKDFKNSPIPCPQHWGGYKLNPKEIEFWKNREHRLHDRFLFTKTTKSWSHQRLFP